MGYTNGDIGGCCNCPGGCPCVPCALPATDLHLNITSVNAAGGVVFNVTSPFAVNPATCTWTCGFTTLGGQDVSATMTCGASCFSLVGLFTTGLTTIVEWWDSPTNCSGRAGQHLVLGTVNCSPLNVVWSFTNAGGTVTWTLMT
jgi:hypothetical protein